MVINENQQRHWIDHMEIELQLEDTQIISSVRWEPNLIQQEL